jgi:putative membrane protein
VGETRQGTRQRPGFGLGGGNGRRGALLAMVPIIALLVGVVTLGATPAQAANDANAIVQTEFGPLTPADRDFLIKVRLAGLWEGPAGRMAQKRSNNPLIREAGQHLIDGHRELDASVIDAGRRLDVELPEKTTKELDTRLRLMDRAFTPEEFDQTFVSLLRAAHGTVYQLVAKIRAGTRNSLIRQFSQRCMEVVLDHITVLEETGLVRWNELPLPPAPLDGARPEAGMIQTPTGPLTMADRDFLEKACGRSRPASSRRNAAAAMRSRRPGGT